MYSNNPNPFSLTVYQQSTSEGLFVAKKSSLNQEETREALKEHEIECKAILVGVAKKFGVNIDRLNLIEIKEESFLNPELKNARTYLLRTNTQSSAAFALEHVLRADNSSAFRIYENTADNKIKMKTWFDPSDKKNQHQVFLYEDIVRLAGAKKAD